MRKRWYFSFFALCVALSGPALNTHAQEVVTVGPRDIIFLIDGSQAMGSFQFNAVREFIKKFIEGMPIGPDEVQVGVAQFTNVPRLEMDLNAHRTKDSLITAVSRLRLRGGTQPVNIGAALDFVRTQMLTADKGSRINQGVPQLLVVLSAKTSSDSVAQPAKELHRLGVLTMAAGSKNSDGQDLKQIAFNPSLVFSVRDFRVLHHSPKLIISSLSTLSAVAITEQPTQPIVEITTVQTQGIIRDIVFLVDGSDYVGEAGFTYVRDFISRIVNQLDVRPDRVQIALLQFARDQRTEFYLNSHNNKQDVLDAVSRIRPMGGNVVNTGAALEYALANHFQRQAGSRKRQRVPQAAVLITGGPAQDEVKRVSDKVALEGVLTYTVGTGQADNSLLSTVAFVPDLAYYVSTFDGLPNVVEEIMTPLIIVVGDTSTVITEVELSGDKRDVAFLVDGTDAVGGDFRYVQDFILNIIEPLDVGADKVRVAVVQHSENPSANFYLDTYKTKDEVIQAIRTMRLAGGRTLNTGEALNFMRNTVFSAERGSRVAQNVSQYLIVLSAGRSRDDVAGPAGALKTEGVLPFGVGVRDADMSQISAISHNPALAFTVRDFDQLNTVQQRLGSYVSLSKENLQTAIKQVHAEDVHKDIVFLLDGSDGTRNGFPAIRDFIQRVVEKLNVGETKHRVSVAQYSRDPEAHFYLNTYSTKEDVLEAVTNMRHKGGRFLNTGAALQFVRHNIFTSSSGSRRLEGVPQILILLMGGKSSDNVKWPAFGLKDLEVTPFSIGVSGADKQELETISNKSRLTYQIPEFSFLPSIQNQNVASIKTLSKNKDETERPGIPGFVDHLCHAMYLKENSTTAMGSANDSDMCLNTTTVAGNDQPVEPADKKTEGAAEDKPAADKDGEDEQ